MGLKDNLARMFIIAARLFCIGDSNLGARLRSLHVRLALRGLPTCRVADAGCGRSGSLGWFGGIAPIAYPLSRYFQDSSVVGFDASEEVVSFNRSCASKAGARNLTFSSLDLRDRYDGELFDVVVFSDIARSRSLDSHLVSSAASLVAPGGLFVMVVPSSHQLVAGNDRDRGLDAGFTESEIDTLMRESGLETGQLRAIIGPLPSYFVSASRKISSFSFGLLVFAFPLMIGLSLVDLVWPPRRGDAFLVKATRPKMRFHVRP